MGNSWSDSTGRGVKRPREVEQASTSDAETSDSGELHTPKRKRFQSTSKYIVKKLFEEGNDSDVTIVSLGRTWSLHKIYLSQCKYFESMFSRQWAESDRSSITVDIDDENVDTEALKIAFKSLYTDNIFVKPVEAVGVVAAATFLQLEPLIEHCKTVMKGCITYKSVCSFHAASERYGLLDVKEDCMTWLLQYLMSPANSPLLTDITEVLLETLLCSRDLWLLQVEVDVYALVKKWVFTQLHPSWSGSGDQLHKDTNDFFKRQAESNGCCFLETEEGHRFIHMFRKVRWMYVINDLSSIQLLKEDKILSVDWLDPVFKFCWTHHLKTEQGADTGPEAVSEEDFYRWAMRCGRVLMHEQEYHWRWLGYQYGLDLLFTFRNKMLTVKRNSGSLLLFSGSLSQQKHKRLMLSVRVAAVKKKDSCNGASVKSTNILSLSLAADEEECVLALDQAVKFPLQVTMHILCISPPPSQSPPCLALPPPPVTVVPTPPPPPSSAAGGPSSDAGPVEGHGRQEREDTEGGAGDPTPQELCVASSDDERSDDEVDGEDSSSTRDCQSATLHRLVLAGGRNNLQRTTCSSSSRSSSHVTRGTASPLLSPLVEGKNRGPTSHSIDRGASSDRSEDRPQSMSLWPAFSTSASSLPREAGCGQSLSSPRTPSSCSAASVSPQSASSAPSCTTASSSPAAGVSPSQSVPAQNTPSLGSLQVQGRPGLPRRFGGAPSHRRRSVQ